MEGFWKRLIQCKKIPRYDADGPTHAKAAGDIDETRWCSPESSIAMENLERCCFRTRVQDSPDVGESNVLSGKFSQ